MHINSPLIKQSHSGLLRASHESRQVFLETFKGFIPAEQDSAAIRFDPNLDTLFIRHPGTRPRPAGSHNSTIGSLRRVRDSAIHISTVVTFFSASYVYHWQRSLWRLTNLQTITLVAPVSLCGSQFSFYNLVDGPDPTYPTLTPESFRACQSSNALQPEIFVKMYSKVQRIRDSLQRDFNEGRISRVPTIFIRGKKVPQKEVMQWEVVKFWLEVLYELQTLIPENGGFRPSRPCDVCPRSFTTTLRLAMRLVTRLPLSLVEVIWKMATPEAEFMKLESFFTTTLPGPQTLGPSPECLQLRLQSFDTETRTITIGMYETLSTSEISNNVIRFHAEDNLSFRNMSKWQILGWNSG